MKALFDFLDAEGLTTRDEDLGYGIHAWLNAAFGDLAPKPWRLFMDHRRPSRILGYSPHAASELHQHLYDFAIPSAFDVCADPMEMIKSKPVPTWRPGRRLGFEVHCCPVGRKSGTGIEKDLFLLQADSSNTPIDRDTVYCNWVRMQLEKDDATSVIDANLFGFRLVRQSRSTQEINGQRVPRQLTRPQAIIRGELIVNSPAKFTDILARGIGRHRAFGYGTVLLRPSS